MTDVPKGKQKQEETDAETKHRQKLEKARERHRERYANDPEYREWHKQRCRKSYRKQKEVNAEHYNAVRNKYQAQYNARYRERYKNDPLYIARCRWSDRKKYEKIKERLKNDPEFAERFRLRSKRNKETYQEKINSDPIVAQERLTLLRLRKRAERRNNRSIKAYKKQMTKDEIKDLKRRFLEAIEKSAFIGITAKYLGITEGRVYGWMQKDIEFANAVRAAKARTADRVGLALINKALTENDTSAQIFICKTLGRSLGFDEKQPVVNINMNTQPDMDLSELSLEEKDQLLNLLRKSKSKQIEQGTIDIQ
jgi:hypothetical protein